MRVFGHPVHPALSDFPLVLLIAAPVASAVAMWHPEWVGVSTGRLLLIAGLVAAIPTAVAGFLDFAGVPSGSAAAQTGIWHMVVMLSAVSSSALALVFDGMPAMLLEALGALLLLAGGWLGGHLVFHHGVGVDEQRGDRGTGA